MPYEGFGQHMYIMSAGAVWSTCHLSPGTVLGASVVHQVMRLSSLTAPLVVYSES